jgi:hypothetical protein
VSEVLEKKSEEEKKKSKLCRRGEGDVYSDGSYFKES